MEESTSATYGEGDAANGYYGNADSKPFNEPGYSENNNEDVIGGHFINANPKPEYKCKGCNSTFVTRNQLFKHLKQECWKKEDETKTEPKAIPPVEALYQATEPLIKEQLPVIVSNADPSAGTGLAFKNYYYAILPLAFHKDITDAKDVCADSGCTMSMADK